MLSALLILFFMYYEISQKTLQVFIGLLVLSCFVLTGAGSTVFFLLSAFLIFFLFLRLLQKYRIHPDKASLLVLTGFALWFVAKLFNGLVFLNEEMYLISNIFKLAGFGTILYSLRVISK